MDPSWLLIYKTYPKMIPQLHKENPKRKFHDFLSCRNFKKIQQKQKNTITQKENIKENDSMHEVLNNVKSREGQYASQKLFPCLESLSPKYKRETLLGYQVPHSQEHRQLL